MAEIAFKMSYSRILCWIVFACGISVLSMPAQENATTSPQPSAQAEELRIEGTELPVTYPHGQYTVTLHARGKFVPVLAWKVVGGELPPGLALDETGAFRGAAERSGEFRFTAEVKDGSSPQQVARRDFVVKVIEAITVNWKVPPRVNGNRIDGSIEVTNTTAEDIDLTFDVKAIAQDGRATEIGYQHFALKKGTVGMTLPFGETLPHGAYLVRADVVGEVAQHQAIYREALQSPGMLQIVTTP